MRTNIGYFSGAQEDQFLQLAVERRRADSNDDQFTRCFALLVRASRREALARTNRLGETALHTTAKYALPRLVALLLEAGVDVNARTAAGSTPLS